MFFDFRKELHTVLQFFLLPFTKLLLDSTLKLYQVLFFITTLLQGDYIRIICFGNLSYLKETESSCN